MERTTDICVSGLGAVSPLGTGLSETASRLFSGTAAPRLPVCFETTLPLPVFEAPDSFGRGDANPAERTMRLFETALEQAFGQAGITSSGLAGRRVGVCVGTTVACQFNDIPFYERLRSGGASGGEPLRRYIGGNPAESIRRKFRLEGPALTVSNACASGSDAIGIAALWIETGLCEMAIAGGADALSKITLDGFHALGLCSRNCCRPFDARRDGLNLGEGAAVVILEAAASAKARGKHPSFAVAGFGKTADAFHITQPDPSGAGLASAVDTALSRAGVAPEAVGFVNAHGTGTPANDGIEARVLASIFGSDLKYMSTKALSGHALGAAGALEFVFSCLMLERGIAVKSSGFETLSTDIPVPPLSAAAPFDAEYALSTSLAFGGSNSAILARRLK